MREYIDKIREINLVGAGLLQLDPDLKLKVAESSFVDLLVELPVDDARFAILTWPSRDFKSKDFGNVIAMVENNIQHIEGLPLYVASYDEEKGLMIDMLVKWNFGESVINGNPNLKILNAESLDKFYDSVRHQDSQIRILQDKNLKVIKCIPLRVDRYGMSCDAQFMYLRDLSQSYKMNPKPVQNCMERYNRNLNGQPQDEYPHDLLDDYILTAIRTVYPDADFKDSLLVTNTEYRNLLRYRNYQHDFVEIRFLPDLSEVPVEMLPVFEKFEGAKIQFDIYMHIRPNVNAFSNEGFELRFPLDGWLNTLNSIVFQLQTFHKVSDLINQ